ncbi:nucleolar protein 12 [Ictalurus punctatus]|uniref:Nucleolar protein 12 n=1 Tax=Ictalurus punctatus TaxID=7998 RepID=A0A2D0S2M1_ICTPU|nr:nucleolar protein 12 [Ictalurus punctatus]XP_053494442.1 nucleolar protein 12 [Ictalurus furcatus]
MGKQKKHGQSKAGSKLKPGFKNRQNKCVVMFDDKERHEFLTGFHKRKVERRKAAVEEIKNKLREEQKRVREERHKEYLKMLKERKEALEDADELDDVITSTTESLQYDHPNHTVTVTTISDLDLSSARLLESLTNHAAGAGGDEDDERGDKEEKVEALPRKAGNPLLSKKIQSLSASLHTFTKQKKRKSKKDTWGRSQQGDRKSSVAMGNKHRFGRTTKKQRRKRTGRNERSQD